MVRCWYMQDAEGKDQRDPLELKDAPAVTLEDLESIGVLYWKLNADDYESEGKLKKIRDEREYTYFDVIEINENLEEYEKKLKMFFSEHLHGDEEIRFFLDGSGYFDLRNKEDKWIRIELGKGDLIVLPAGIYHRFTLDHKNHAKVMRLFQGVPVWTAFNRPGADSMPIRQQFLQTLAA